MSIIPNFIVYQTLTYIWRTSRRLSIHARKVQNLSHTIKIVSSSEFFRYSLDLHQICAKHVPRTRISKREHKSIDRIRQNLNTRHNTNTHRVEKSANQKSTTKRKTSSKYISNGKVISNRIGISIRLLNARRRAVLM